MKFREAELKDIGQILFVRNSVTENTLSNPDAVTDEICGEYLSVRGKGWICEIGSTIIGFSIVDLKENNIWALFVHPDHDKQGIGKMLHNIMLDWYFEQSKETVWLGTGHGTRAETFYRGAGWTEVGLHGKDEIKFEMNYTNWINRNKKV